MTALEIAVQDPEGVAIAAQEGADRIELCSALAIGGLTPSAALIQHASAAELPVHVLIRPRGGDFSYSRAERRVMLGDVRRSIDAGAAGVVIGAVEGDGIDAAFMAEVRRTAPTMTVTFHRAFDLLGAPLALLDVLVDLGFDRVLTSGGERTALKGVGRLSELVDLAAGRIEIMAGGGVVSSSVAALLAAGVDAVHASARAASGVPVATDAALALGERDRTDAASVRGLRGLVR